MELIVNTPFDVRSQYGHLIVLCLDSYEAKTLELRQALSAQGYNYLFFPISDTTLSQRDYLSEITKALDSCTCLVPVIAEGLFAPENRVLCNVFWFVLGYMTTRQPEGIVPYLAEGDGRGISSTPLKNANFAASCEEVVRTLDKKFAHRLMKNHYYDNYMLNFYAAKRIMYRRIVMRCRIDEQAYQRVASLMEYEWGQNAEARLDRFLATNLFSAFRILGFGCDNAIEPQFEPYREEIYPSENGVASSVICHSTYRVLEDEERAVTGTHAELEVEVVVPVHKLFGVYFKCYMALKQTEYAFMLPTLFARDLGGYEGELPSDDDTLEDASFWNLTLSDKTHTDLCRGRFYFSLGLERQNAERSILLTPERGVGSHADYIFPQ